MLLLLFVVVMDSCDMAMHCFTSVVFCQLRVSIGDDAISKQKNKGKKIEVGNIYIGWTIVIPGVHALTFH